MNNSKAPIKPRLIIRGCIVCNCHICSQLEAEYFKTARGLPLCMSCSCLSCITLRSSFFNYTSITEEIDLNPITKQLNLYKEKRLDAKVHQLKKFDITKIELKLNMYFNRVLTTVDSITYKHSQTEQIRVNHLSDFYSNQHIQTSTKNENIILSGLDINVNFEQLTDIYKHTQLSAQVIDYFLKMRAQHNLSSNKYYYYASSLLYTTLSTCDFKEMFDLVNKVATKRYLTDFYCPEMDIDKRKSLELIIDFDLAFIPVFEDEHWSLAAFSFPTNEAFYFDSRQSESNEILRNIQRLFYRLAKHYKRDAYKIRNMKLYNININVNRYTVHGGAYVCLNLLLMENKFYEYFDPVDISKFRRWMFTKMVRNEYSN